MSIETELEQLEHDTEIELFELSEFNPASPSEKFRFCNHDGVSFGGKAYSPLPCSLDGISYTSEGSLPRPKLKVSDAQQGVSSLMYLYGGFEGATLTIRRTLKMFLDGEATADASQEKPHDVYMVSQKTQEVPGKFIEFELCSAIDFNEEQLPGRYLSQKCVASYRDATSGCPYSGKDMFTIDDKRTSNPRKDVCGKTTNSCQKRFGKNTLPHTGFPGLRRF